MIAGGVGSMIRAPFVMPKAETAFGHDAQAVILKIPEPIRSAREHLHLRVEPFGDPLGLDRGAADPVRAA
jgi:hypothetical protein